MITTREMRIFSRECLKWAKARDNASDRETIIRVARMWIKTASAIGLRQGTRGEPVPDLRRKLD